MGGTSWIARRRLLDRLPRDPGYVVWLQAPYGFGKTVLLQQWADHLQAEGWHAVWGSAAMGPLSEQVSRALGFDGAGSWKLVSALLADRRVLLVLDDLTPEALAELKGIPKSGLVAIASRCELAWPELPRARTQGRLVHVTADELRFTLPEVRQLIPDDRKAYEVWEASGGWPIAVHMAALTGTLDLRKALARGVRESLGEAEWEELLFLSAVPALPDELAGAPLRRLADSGFVQRTPHGYRLHALFAEVLQETAHEEIQRVVRQRAPQLPGHLCAEAYFSSGLLGQLEELLDSQQALGLVSRSPSQVLRWCRALPGPGGPWRRLAYGWALTLLGRLREAFARLQRLAEEVSETHPEVALLALGLVAYNAPEVDLALALLAVEQGWRLVDRVGPHPAARFLNWAVWPLWKAGQLERFQEALEEARRRLPPDDPYTFHPTGYNLAFLRWQLDGDLEHYLGWNRQTAELQERTQSHNLPLTLVEMGCLLVLRGDRAGALRCFREAQARPGWNYWAETLAAAWQAYLEWDPKPFHRLASLAEAQENPELQDAVRGLWARTLREGGSAQEALSVCHPPRGFWTALEAASALHALGRQEEAVQHLPDEPREREERAFYRAARYRILRSEEDLDALVALTTLGPRILPALLDLHDLPKHRPDLADPYPIEDVLRSGWKEAIERRKAEIPHLEVQVLGEFRVRRLGEDVHLPPTSRKLLVCLLLGLDREAMAEHLWPDAPADQARNTLHVHLHTLRRALEPWGVPTYLTSSGLQNVRADLWELQEALQRGDAETVARLYREPVAPGVDLPVVDEARVGLQRRVVDLLFRRGCQAHAEDGLRYLRRVLELDPFHEPALQGLLRHLLALGHRRAALDEYRAFEDRLRRELGTDPAPETRAWLETLKAPPRRAP